MKRLEFDCVFDFAEDIISLLGEIDEKYPVISVYGKYDVIKVLLEDLIMSGVEIKESIELESYQIDYYDKEFVLYLTEDGVSVCKCWKYDGYLGSGGDLSFVHEDCSSKLLKHIVSKTIYEFGVGSDEDTNENCDCDKCQCACKEEAKPTASTTAVYKVNGKEVDKEEFDKKCAEFDNKHMDNIRDMLLRYCEFMDEMNEWSKRIW